MLKRCDFLLPSLLKISTLLLPSFSEIDENQMGISGIFELPISLLSHNRGVHSTKAQELDNKKLKKWELDICYYLIQWPTFNHDCWSSTTAIIKSKVFVHSVKTHSFVGKLKLFEIYWMYWIQLNIISKDRTCTVWRKKVEFGDSLSLRERKVHE